MTINEALQRFRQEQRLTRKAVADTLGIKAQSYIYEKKEVTPSAELILKLAKAFNVCGQRLAERAVVAGELKKQQRPPKSTTKF